MSKFQLVLLFSALLLWHVVASHDPHPHHSDGTGYQDVGFSEDLNTQFQQCFCWNTSSNYFCHAKLGPNGEPTENSFWRKPCRNFVVKASLWALPVVLTIAFFVFFPFFFVAGRMLCNCCGGRKPNFQICCADAPKEGEDSTPREYTNRAIFLTKLTVCVFFGFFVYYCVGVYTTNNGVHWDLIHVINDIKDTTNAMQSELNETAVAFEKLSTSFTIFPIIPPNAASDLSGKTKEFVHRNHQIHNFLNHIVEAESDQSWGRFENTYRYPSVSLFIVVVAFLLMFCHVRGIVISSSAMLLSWSGAIVCCIFLLHMILAQASSISCSNFNNTFVPMVVGAVHGGHGCGCASVVNSINDTSFSYWRHLCTNATVTTGPTGNNVGLQDLCLTEFDCPLNACQRPTWNTSADDDEKQRLQRSLINTTEILLTLSQSKKKQSPNQGESILNCSSPTCLAVVKLVKEYNALFLELNDVTLPKYYNCSTLRSQLHGPINSVLCGAFNRNYTSIAIVLLALTLLHFFGIFLFILGAKRFLKMDLSKEHAQGEDVSAKNFIYGTIVTKEDAQMYFGTPYQSPTEGEASPFFAAPVNTNAIAVDEGVSCQGQHPYHAMPAYGSTQYSGNSS